MVVEQGRSRGWWGEKEEREGMDRKEGCGMKLK
jgi:hypothetical protein